MSAANAHSSQAVQSLLASYLRGENKEAAAKALEILSEDPHCTVASDILNLAKLRSLYAARSLPRVDALLKAGVEDARKAFASSLYSYFQITYQVPWFVVGGEPPEIPQAKLGDARLVTNRLALLDYMPKHGRVAEIGTLTGRFAMSIIKASLPEKLHLIDMSFANLDRDILSEYLNNGTIETHAGDSSSIISRFPDDYFDWIYIDGDHSFEGVKKDIEAARRKVRVGGFLVFNDYTCWSVPEGKPYGVLAAVNEFACEDNGWTVKYLALQNIGSYDIAFQRT